MTTDVFCPLCKTKMERCKNVFEELVLRLKCPNEDCFVGMVGVEYDHNHIALLDAQVSSQMKLAREDVLANLPSYAVTGHLCSKCKKKGAVLCSDCIEEIEKDFDDKIDLLYSKEKEIQKLKDEFNKLLTRHSRTCRELGLNQAYLEQSKEKNKKLRDALIHRCTFKCIENRTCIYQETKKALRETEVRE